MIIRRLSDIEGSDQEIDTPNWTSRRLLLAGDGMGFSLHDTLINEGTETEMCYRNHLEAVYCIEGEGEIENLADGSIHPLQAGTAYALDEHDHHVLRARRQMRMVCVFNPPITGAEVHDESGAYPLIEATATPTTHPKGHRV